MPRIDDSLRLRKGANSRIARSAPSPGYRDNQTKAGSNQWRDALDTVRDLCEPELIDWVCLQIEVARNIEQGMQDLRPRKNGPTFLIMLEFVANQKRKALAVLHWFQDAEKHGGLSASSRTLTDTVLDIHESYSRSGKNERR